VNAGIEISRLVGLFVAAAKSIGKSIIEDFHMPKEQKRVPPFAGIPESMNEQDDLFITNGILFRFAADPHGEQETPGSDDVSMKIAAHEIKGLQAYLQAGVSGLHTALTCTIDYMGFRLIAIAVVPADGQKTLVYGVTPALPQQDFNIARMLQEAAEELNLKEHIVFSDVTRPLTIHTAMDVQVRCIPFAMICLTKSCLLSVGPSL